MNYEGARQTMACSKNAEMRTQTQAAAGHTGGPVARGGPVSLVLEDGPTPFTFHSTAFQYVNGCPTGAMQEWRYPSLVHI